MEYVRESNFMLSTFVLYGAPGLQNESYAVFLAVEDFTSDSGYAFALRVCYPSFHIPKVIAVISHFTIQINFRRAQLHATD